jgi:hypothetical protein
MSKRSKKSTRSSRLIIKKNGGRDITLPTDFFDPNLDPVLERSFGHSGNTDITEEEINRQTVLRLLNNLIRRIRNNPENPRIETWNFLLQRIETAFRENNVNLIMEYAHRYRNARELAFPPLPDFSQTQE